ncbi:DUF86 domain-containing protein [Echinicola marina]|uniref:HepT-like ribonuclease domain-containing protein n=1 Tax=Echinicola marina TaxID=2859768 RepID=UPI001CF61269|nr:HepT-like ribonuclease domain-containing protein [Echinicola marina]UCS92153.1 DUF86 domain-containing protein [Echinicola marina]
MQHNVKKYLLDIATSIETINEFLGDQRDFKAYESNKLLRRAVEREMEIIGEATNRLLKIQPDIEISDARRIVNLRNWVIHAYETMWTISLFGGSFPKTFHFSINK